MRGTTAEPKYRRVLTGAAAVVTGTAISHDLVRPVKSARRSSDDDWLSMRQAENVVTCPAASCLASLSDAGLEAKYVRIVRSTLNNGDV